jgi:hypothetical protein
VHLENDPNRKPLGLQGKGIFNNKICLDYLPAELKA